jgi:uncharacterized membrane protein
MDTMMTLPHLHLLVNHVPTVGTAIAIGLLILTIVRKHDAIRRVSLELFCLIALVTLPAYLSGVGTQLRLEEQLPDVSVALMQRHHDAAVLSSILMLLTGGFAWIGLWQFRRISRQTGFNLGAVLLLSVLTMVLMARTATMGGEIRHPEILLGGAASADAATAAGGGWLSAGAIAALVNERVWLWPAMETLHFIGLWLLFGVIVLVNVRMLGMLTNTSYASLHRLLPWAALGLGINIVTGMMFVIANPGQYANAVFYWKIGLLVLAGVNLIYLTVFDGPWEVREGDRAPLRVRAMAASAIVLWVGVMYFGRMLPFLGDAF